MSTELTNIDPAIRDITRLAHSANEADSREYQALQPRLVELCNQKDALEGRGVATQSHTAVATHGGDVPSHWAGYPRLPTSDQFDAVDAQAFEAQLPELHRHGFSIAQVAILTQILERGSREAQRLRRQAADDHQAKTKSYMAGQYGSRWRTLLDNANRYFQGAKRHHKNVQVGQLILADGTRLGDNAYYISQCIDVAESGR